MEVLVKGDVVAFDELIERKPECLRFSNHRRETLLHIAARLGRVDIVKALIRRGVSASVRRYFDKGKNVTPLYSAAEHGRMEVARLLLDSGVDVNAGAGVHSTPLIAASRSGYAEMVMLLLERGADVFAAYVIETAEGPASINALLAAVCSNQEAVVSILMQHIHARLGEAAEERIAFLLAARSKLDRLKWWHVVPAFDVRVDLSGQA